jgi:hypothetical protein
MNEPTSISQGTADEERVEAKKAHDADRGPTAEEAEAADRSRQSMEAEAPDVADHSSEMTKVGAKVKGEGAIE